MFSCKLTLYQSTHTISTLASFTRTFMSAMYRFLYQLQLLLENSIMGLHGSISLTIQAIKHHFPTKQPSCARSKLDIRQCNSSLQLQHNPSPRLLPPEGPGDEGNYEVKNNLFKFIIIGGDAIVRGEHGTSNLITAWQTRRTALQSKTRWIAQWVHGNLTDLFFFNHLPLMWLAS